MRFELTTVRVHNPGLYRSQTHRGLPANVRATRGLCPCAPAPLARGCSAEPQVRHTGWPRRITTLWATSGWSCAQTVNVRRLDHRHRAVGADHRMRFPIPSPHDQPHARRRRRGSERTGKTGSTRPWLATVDEEAEGMEVKPVETGVSPDAIPIHARATNFFRRSHDSQVRSPPGRSVRFGSSSG